MRSCFMLRILPVAFICFFGLPILSIADSRNSDQDIPLIVREEEESNSSDLGLQSASILLDAIERLLNRLDSSAVPPQDNDIQRAPETSWPPLENDFLSRDHIYLPKSSSSNALKLKHMTSYGKSQRTSCTEGFLCRVIRGRNPNAGARALPFGKRGGNKRNSGDESGTSSVRGRRRGRGRPPPVPRRQRQLPFGKRRV